MAIWATLAFLTYVHAPPKTQPSKKVEIRGEKTIRAPKTSDKRNTTAHDADKSLQS